MSGGYAARLVRFSTPWYLSLRSAPSAGGPYPVRRQKLSPLPNRFQHMPGPLLSAEQGVRPGSGARASSTAVANAYGQLSSALA